MLCILCAKVFHLAMGLFMKLAVDALSSSDQVLRHRGPLRAAVLFLILRLLVSLSTQGFEVAQSYYSQITQHRFALYAFSEIMSQSVTFHHTRRTGETSAILRRGCGALDVLLRQLLFWLLPTVTETIYVTAIFWHLGSPSIAVAVALTVIVHITYTARLTTLRATLARSQRDAENAAWAHTHERLATHTTVCEFDGTLFEVATQDALRYTVRRTTFASTRLASLYDASADAILQIGTFVGFALAARDAANGILSVGDFALAVTYISALFWPLLVLARSYGDVVTALANAEQLVRLLQTTPLIRDKPGAIILPTPNRRSPSLTFQRVSFAYASNDDGGVRNMSFTLNRGETLAVVGPSGAGKSTLVRLLLRLYDVGIGRILVHGADIRDVTQKSLRRGIALVAQDTVLFSGTIRDNVRYAIEDNTTTSGDDASIWRALRAAALDQFVRSLPDTLDTVVGERGVRLSGGEKQRVGIARALIRRPHIMVLDEATSALSALDELAVQRSLKESLKHAATLIVAHRLASVRHANEILVVDNGRIVERGTHDHLVTVGGTYARMWHAQSSAQQ